MHNGDDAWCKAHVDWLVAERAGQLLGDIDLAGVVLLAHAQRGGQEVVLGGVVKGGAHGVGVPLALGIDELLGEFLLLFASHVCGLCLPCGWERACYLAVWLGESVRVREVSFARG